jgi:hypothetical protein
MDAEGKNVSGNAQIEATTTQHDVVKFLPASVGVKKPSVAYPFVVSGLDVDVHTPPLAFIIASAYSYATLATNSVGSSPFFRAICVMA